MINEIHRLAGIVRKHIHTHRYQSVLISQHDVWNQICSSLDVIDDTLLAISSFLDSKFPDDDGAKYLSTYGILQALFIQQGALKHLSEAFDIKYSPDDRLNNIREIRNASIGHPSKLNRKKSVYYFHLVRHSLSKNGFELFEYNENRTRQIKVNFNELIDEQLAAIIDKYSIIEERL